MNTALFIFYVKDQERSTNFYSHVLERPPSLDVPGMTEFTLSDNVKIGLMPESGIAKIICPALPDPAYGNGLPRAEFYLYDEAADRYYENAINMGGTKVTDMIEMDWGHTVGYVADLDGHVLAFAK